MGGPFLFPGMCRAHRGGEEADGMRIRTRQFSGYCDARVVRFDYDKGLVFLHFGWPGRRMGDDT